MNQQPTHIALSIGVAQAIANYLATQPFNQVAEFMAAFQAAPTVRLPPEAQASAADQGAYGSFDDAVQQAVIARALTEQKATQNDKEAVPSAKNGAGASIS